MFDPELCWKAVAERDIRFDGKFVFAVRSTGIYCRPSCPARRPARSNVAFYASTELAEAAGFRACKRCTPHGLSAVQQMDALVEAACRILDDADRITLAQLAARIGVSPSHLARAFKMRTGLSPRAWAEYRRTLRLQDLLPGARSVQEASLQTGYASTRALYEKPPMAPAQRRRLGRNETLRYTIAESPLGYLLMAASEKGVCALLFDDAPEPLLGDLSRRFAAATLVRDDEQLKPWFQQILAQLKEPARAQALPLDLRGSAYQLRVWQALQVIPTGETRTYSALATELSSHPRAVARACASNAVGLLVPCHRVIAASGKMSGYRWGIERKVELLESERQGPKAEPQAQSGYLKE
jgi:AraC family transcriptional regulator of adaptative response/methylated-DNA-[protein]-cysteine methyltransferase